MKESFINIFLVALPILTVLAWIAGGVIAISLIVWAGKWLAQKIRN